MRRLVLLALPALLAISAPASAQPLPGCSPNNANERMCRDGNVCVCRITGGLLHGMPQAFRWDCGIQNGGCIPGAYESYVRTPGQGGAVVVVPSQSRTTTTTTVRRATTSIGKTEIARAQTALARLGFDPGPADGKVGPKTRAALALYLAREGLPPSGRLTPEIYRRLVP
jgi:hypothetical protein